MKHEFYLVFEITMFIGVDYRKTTSTIKYGTFITMEDPDITKPYVQALTTAMKEKFMETEEFSQNGMQDCMVTLLSWNYLGEPVEEEEEGKTEDNVHSLNKYMKKKEGIYKI